MTTKPFIFILLFLSTVCAADSFPVISPDQFQVGSFWTWAYSEVDKNTKEVKAPYLFETYRVVAKDGALVTIEMSSSPHPRQSTPAHHRFVANVATCSSNRDHRPKMSWFIEFYTRSLGNHHHWELVSKRYDGFAFEEKFNCHRQSPPLQVDRENGLFHFKRAGSAWYYENSGALTAVAARKEFKGKLEYRFQLFDFSSSSAQRANF